MPSLPTGRPVTADSAAPRPPAPKLPSHARGYDRRHRSARAGRLAAHPLCERCGREWSHHLHHKNRDPFDRSPANLEALCAGCHRLEHLHG